MKERESRKLHPEYYRSREDTLLLEQLRDELAVARCEIHNSEMLLTNNYKWKQHKPNNNLLQTS